jgi:alpha-L-arabinofuranosidase
MDEDGNLVMTLCNADLNESKTIDAELLSFKAISLEGEYVAGTMTDHNTFENPSVVVKKKFDGMILTGNGLTATLPPCSVVKIVAKA